MHPRYSFSKYVGAALNNNAIFIKKLDFTIQVLEDKYRKMCLFVVDYELL